jgi:serine/threonine protein kinase
MRRREYRPKGTWDTAVSSAASPNQRFFVFEMMAASLDKAIHSADTSGANISDYGLDRGGWTDKTAFVLCCVASALAHLNNLSFVHRDVKPSNILLSDVKNGAYEVKLCDFGLARQSKFAGLSTGVRTQDTAQWGTKVYMAPEQIDEPKDRKRKKPMNEENQGDPEIRVSSKADVWALGCVLYECVQQEQPWSHVGEQQDMDTYAEGTVPTKGNDDLLKRFRDNVLSDNTQQTARTVADETREQLGRLLQKCWEMRPENRASILHVEKRLGDLQLMQRMMKMMHACDFQD